MIQVRSTSTTGTTILASLYEERGATKAEKIPQRRLQFNLFAVHASLLALNHERQFRSAGGTNFCKQVCLSPREFQAFRTFLRCNAKAN